MGKADFGRTHGTITISNQPPSGNGILQMKSLYTDRLESFSFEEMLGALNAVGVETQRLEFKREIPARALAQEVCSFANANGGIIVIGIEEPRVGGGLGRAANSVVGPSCFNVEGK